MQTVVPEVAIDQATIARIGIGQLTLGQISVGELVAAGVRMGVHSGRAELSDVRVTVTLRFRLVWSVHIPLPWPFPDFTISETVTPLGSLTLPPFPFGDAEIPGLEDINLQIPQLLASGVVTEAEPITGLELTGVRANDVRVLDVTLPTGGFSFAGLSLTGANANDLSVPATAVRGVAVRQLTSSPIRLPSFRLRGLDLPAAAANDIGSGPIDLFIDRSDPFTIPTEGPLDLEVLTVELEVEASARTEVAQMKLSGVQASASAETIELRNVTIPFGAVEVTLGDLGLDVIEIPLVGVA